MRVAAPLSVPQPNLASDEAKICLSKSKPKSEKFHFLIILYFEKTYLVTVKRGFVIIIDQASQAYLDMDRVFQRNTILGDNLNIYYSTWNYLEKKLSILLQNYVELI